MDSSCPLLCDTNTSPISAPSSMIISPNPRALAMYMWIETSPNSW